MKKILTLCCAAVGLFVGSAAFADYAQDGQDWSGQGQGQGGCCAQQEQQCAPAESYAGDCYCLMCKYEPYYYKEWHTVCEPQCYQKKCCRMVPKQYEKCCVKYVPQYYTQTCCRYEPETYYQTETRNVSRKVCENKCKYVPKYYYKHVCGQAGEGAAAAASTGCCQ